MKDPIFIELAYWADRDLKEWFDADLEVNELFARKLAKYADDNTSEFYSYTRSITPKEFSELSIIYESLSEYSVKHYDFLYSEVQRVVNTVNSGNMPADELELLVDIELEKMYDLDRESYNQIIEYLISILSQSSSKDIKHGILEVLDFYLIESNETEEKEWARKLDIVKQNSDASIAQHIDSIFDSTVKKPFRFDKPLIKSILWIIVKIIAAIIVITLVKKYI